MNSPINSDTTPSKSFILILCTVIFLILGFIKQSPAFAEKAYVNDNLTITLRSGKGTQFAILRELRVGSAMEVLEVDNSSGYAKVRLENSGVEGWVLNRFITTETPARDLLIKSEASVNDLNSKLNLITNESESLQSSFVELTNNNQILELNYENLQTEFNQLLELSQDAIDLQERYTTLKAESENLSSQYSLVQQDLQNLESNNMQQWFLIGGGVLLLGIILGVILPHIRLPQKSSWKSSSSNW